MSNPSTAANATTDPAAAAILAHIGTITGPMLLGHLFNWALFGVLSLQVYIYSISSYGDKLGIMILVYFLFFLDVLQTAFATHYAWYVLAGGWGNLPVLNFTPWTLATNPLLSGLISFLVQGLFSWRIWILAPGNKLFYLPLLGLIGITAGASCLAAWYAGIESAKLRDVSQASLLDPEVTVWLACSMACDAMITISLVWLLWRRRGEGFKNVNHIIHRAIRMTIETGALTTIVTAVELALYLNSSVTSWYFMFGMLMGKLYSNSLLATFNSRSPTFRKQNQTSSTGAQVWMAQSSESRAETTTATSFTHANPQKNDIELGQVRQDMNRYDSKPYDLASDSTAFPVWKR